MNKVIIIGILSICAIGVLYSCQNSKEKERVNFNQTENMQELQVNDEVKQLLDGLNRAVLAGGDPEHPIDGVVSKGESNAKFEEFKRRIETAGYRIKWCDTKYILVLNDK